MAVKGFRRKMLAAAVIYGLATLLASGLWGIHMLSLIHIYDKGVPDHIQHCQ